MSEHLVLEEGDTVGRPLMVMGSSGIAMRLWGFFGSSFSCFPSWTDYYCVIKKIKFGLFSEKSKRIPCHFRNSNSQK